MTSELLTTQVREKYGAIARSAGADNVRAYQTVAEAFGYTPEELASIPAAANMGLSCGNPTATANLRPGEVVVDLGCGGGLDVFLAARKVGPSGKAIGIDMTPDMVERATTNAAKQRIANVEFHLATIDHLPLPDASVDCLISNCVINLAPDKPAVFREMFRVLKPGGRVAVSDIALKKSLPDELSQEVLAYVGCIAGAVLIEDYERDLRSAGFQVVRIVDTMKDLNAYAAVEGQSGCCASPAVEKPAAEACCTPAPAGSDACCVPKPESKQAAGSCCTPAPAGSSSCCTLHPASDSQTVHGALAELLRKYDVNEYAASVQVYALKG